MEKSLAKSFSMVAAICYGISLLVELLVFFVIRQQCFALMGFNIDDPGTVDIVGIAVCAVSFAIVLITCIIVRQTDDIQGAFVVSLIEVILLGIITIASPLFSMITNIIAFKDGAEAVSALSVLISCASSLKLPTSFVGFLFVGMSFGALCCNRKMSK